MKYTPKSLNRNSIQIGAKECVCGICRGKHATRAPLIKVASDFQRPSVLENYHISCYFHWALHEWKDWLIDIRHMSPASASKHLKEVQDILRIQAPWTIVENYFDMGLGDSPKTIENLLGRLIDRMTLQGTPASWAGRSGFIPWMTNAPRIPANFLTDETVFPELAKHPECLLPFWETYLKEQTNLTPHSIQEYLRLAPRCFYSSDRKRGETAAWDGSPYGFWCWSQTLKKVLENRMNGLVLMKIQQPAIQPSFKVTLADLIPPEACEPPDGPVFEPRTIETTDGNIQKKIPDNSLNNCPIPDVSEPDLPVPERDPEDYRDFHILQEQEAPDFTPDTFVLNTPSATEDSLLTGGLWNDKTLFCKKFDEYLGQMLIKKQVSTSEIINSTDPQPHDSAELYMFRYLYRIYKSYISEKK